LFLALLSMVMLDGVQSASCEMHGLGAAGARAGVVEGAGIMVGSGAAAHEHGAPMDDTRMPGCDCSCIGACTVVAPLAVTPTFVTLRVALVAPQPRRDVNREPAIALPREPDRLLPFANGPPATALL
jgi:hypothetical protein